MLWSTADSSSVPASYASLNDDRSGDVAAVPVIASGVDVADPTFVVNEAGYKQELMANGFSQLMNFSFCFTAVAVTASISVLFNYGLGTGGPAVMIWGWIISCVFTLIIGASLAEISATYPSAGSVYHWAGQMAPLEWAPFASFICGWLNFVGNAAGDASYAYGCAQLIAAAVALNHPGDPSPPLSSTGAQVGLSILVAAVWAVKNCAPTNQQGIFNNASALFQMVSTVVVVLVLMLATPMRSTSSFVWESTYNNTGASSMIYVSAIGILMSLFSFSGYEAGAHMAEETEDATSSAPWSIVHTCIAGGVTGFVYLLGLLYAALNVDLVLQGDSEQAVVNIYTQAFTEKLDTTGWNPAINSTCPDPLCCDASNPACVLRGPVKTAGATALTVLLILNVFCAGFSSLTVTSRIGFAMARDGAMPGSKWLHAVSSRTKAPSHMLFLVFLIDAVLCCLPLVNTTAFAAITGITTIGFQLSYALPILMRLTAARKSFVQTPGFNLGRLSEPVGWVALLWLFVTSVMLFFPTSFDAEGHQTASGFNYTCVVVGGTLAIALAYWFAPKEWGGARWHFVGPKRADRLEPHVPSSDKPAAEDANYVPLVHPSHS